MFRAVFLESGDMLSGRGDPVSTLCSVQVAPQSVLAGSNRPLVSGFVSLSSPLMTSPLVLCTLDEESRFQVHFRAKGLRLPSMYNITWYGHGRIFIRLNHVSQLHTVSVIPPSALGIAPARYTVQASRVSLPPSAASPRNRRQSQSDSCSRLSFVKVKSKRRRLLDSQLFALPAVHTPTYPYPLLPECLWFLVGSYLSGGDRLRARLLCKTVDVAMTEESLWSSHLMDHFEFSRFTAFTLPRELLCGGSVAPSISDPEAEKASWLDSRIDEIAFAGVPPPRAVIPGFSSLSPALLRSMRCVRRLEQLVASDYAKALRDLVPWPSDVMLAKSLWNVTTLDDYEYILRGAVAYGQTVSLSFFADPSKCRVCSNAAQAINENGIMDSHSAPMWCPGCLDAEITPEVSFREPQETLYRKKIAKIGRRIEKGTRDPYKFMYHPKLRPPSWCRYNATTGNKIEVDHKVPPAALALGRVTVSLLCLSASPPLPRSVCQTLSLPADDSSDSGDDATTNGLRRDPFGDATMFASLKRLVRRMSEEYYRSRLIAKGGCANGCQHSKPQLRQAATSAAAQADAGAENTATASTPNNNDSTAEIPAAMADGTSEPPPAVYTAASSSHNPATNSISESPAVPVVQRDQPNCMLYTRILRSLVVAIKFAETVFTSRTVFSATTMLWNKTWEALPARASIEGGGEHPSMWEKLTRDKIANTGLESWEEQVLKDYVCLWNVVRDFEDPTELDVVACTVDLYIDGILGSIRSMTTLVHMRRILWDVTKATPEPDVGDSRFGWVHHLAFYGHQKTIRRQSWLGDPQLYGHDNSNNPNDVPSSSSGTFQGEDTSSTDYGDGWNDYGDSYDEDGYDDYPYPDYTGYGYYEDSNDSSSFDGSFGDLYDSHWGPSYDDDDDDDDGHGDGHSDDAGETIYEEASASGPTEGSSYGSLATSDDASEDAGSSGSGSSSGTTHSNGDADA